MSDLLHRTRLRWNTASGHGSAAHDGVTIELFTRPPVLPHITRIIELEYVPGLAIAYVQDHLSARRDLLPGESSHCLQWLVHVSSAAREAAAGYP